MGAIMTLKTTPIVCINSTFDTQIFIELYIPARNLTCTQLVVYFWPFWWLAMSLMLSSPAWPNRHKSVIHRLFNTNILIWFSKRMSYVQSSHHCSHIGISLNLSVPLKMGSFLSIVVKLYSYIDFDVGNLRKIKYFRDYFRPSCKTRNII